MRTLTLAALYGLSLGLSGCQTTGKHDHHHHDMKPPVAKINPSELEKHGHVRTDNYYWLNERENPDVVAYLAEENTYTKSVMADTESLQKELFEEIKGRIKQNDNTVPYKDGDHYYYTRYEEGKSYPIHCRKRSSLENDEEILLDVNKMAEGHDFYSIRGRDVSPGHDLLAFAVDTVGRRIFTIKFKDLNTGKILDDEIPNVTANLTWAGDNQTIFYARQDPQTLRYYQVYRHRMGTDVSQDVLVYEEKDETFSSYVFKTKSRKYIMIACNQTLSNEYRYLPAENPYGDFKVFQPRERNHEYTVDHIGDKFLIRTNDKARNFRLMETPVANTTRSHWKEVIGHRDDVFLTGFELFNDHMVVSERKNGLVQLRVMPWAGQGEHYLDFGEAAYSAYVGTNREMDSKVLRFGYASMTTPRSVFDYDMETRQKTLKKQDEVLGGFDSADYVTDRLYAPARDGVKVPISIVYRKGTSRDGTNPLLLYAYGSYGASMDAGFSSSRISLLDRGFVFAIAHIRGGQELGRQWYEEGKLLKKKNTFTDFIDCADYLVKQEYTNPGKLYAMGGSAGGLLMGAIANMNPELFDGVIAQVPFVDVITTMLDDSIPLTTSEYDEWGNPNDPMYYQYMLSYSPYDNVEPKDYPNMLVTTGLHDSQVQYWEPAKWVAKLRALKTDDNVLLLKTNMEAGHGGASGRFKRYEETAFRYAFLLKMASRG
ncbi:MAG: S9 family peptidase [Planctomycetota bacterium]|jgi:oligopeptidase B